MRIGAEDSDYCEGLSEQARYIARVIGHSVILAKCYDLMGDEVHARETARRALTSTLDVLTVIRTRRSADRVDGLVRAMYMADLAGRRAILAALAHNLSRVNDAEVRRAEPTSVYAGLMLAAKVVAIRESSIAKKDDVATEIASSFDATRASSGLDSVLADVRALIHIEEHSGSLRPWSDVWHYLVAARVADRIRRELK